MTLLLPFRRCDPSMTVFLFVVLVFLARPDL